MTATEQKETTESQQADKAAPGEETPPEHDTNSIANFVQENLKHAGENSSSIVNFFQANIIAPVINGYTILFEIAQNTMHDDRTFRQMQRRKGLFPTGKDWAPDTRGSALQMLRRQYEKGQYIIFADVARATDQLVAETRNELHFYIILQDKNNKNDWVRLLVAPETTNDDFFALAEKMKFASNMGEARTLFEHRGTAILANHLKKIIDSRRFAG